MNRTIDLINKYDFTIQKKYGQNFLMDDNILKGIVETAGITKEDVVLEIGPGMGALTSYLCEAAGLVIAVEIDRMLIPILKETMSGYENFVLVNEDILKVDIESLVSDSVTSYAESRSHEKQDMSGNIINNNLIGQDNSIDTDSVLDDKLNYQGLQNATKIKDKDETQIFSKDAEGLINKDETHIFSKDAECLINKDEAQIISNGASLINKDEYTGGSKSSAQQRDECRGISFNRKIKVVANLPYYITTPIIMELLEKQDNIASITVMIQKEVAERMQEGPGSKAYGALSLAVQYYSKPCIAMIVSKNCFLPKPDVDSAVINLDIYDKDKRPVKAEDPKKMFDIIRAAFNQRRKTLVNGLSNAQNLNYTKEDILKAISDIGKPETVRGEALTLEEFAKLSNFMKQ